MEVQCNSFVLAENDYWMLKKKTLWEPSQTMLIHKKKEIKAWTQFEFFFYETTSESVVVIIICYEKQK